MIAAMFLIVAMAMFQVSGVTSIADFPSGFMRQIATGAGQIISRAEASKTAIAGTARIRIVNSASLVAAHNKWRNKVGVPPLRWSDALAKDAQAWAGVLGKKNCAMRHSKQREYGENIFWASAERWSDGRREVQNISGESVVNDWASEVRDYNYKKNKCRRGRRCGHYTQLVWRRTQEVGCGVAVCADKSQIWVCRYHPPGNIIGQRPY